MDDPRDLWARAVRPRAAFRQRALEAPGLGEALRGMLLLRVPLAFLELVLGYMGFSALYARLASADSDIWTFILQQVPDANPAELHAALARLPAAPGLHAVLPWMVLAAPLASLSFWLHDAAFDHMALGLLGGLKNRRGFRASLVADAEALKAGALGAAAGLLVHLPGAGLGTGLLLAPVGAWFWILRGYALAAWHDCPPWKGVAATLVHVVLVVVWLFLLLLACLIMVLVIV